MQIHDNAHMYVEFQQTKHMLLSGNGDQACLNFHCNHLEMFSWRRTIHCYKTLSDFSLLAKQKH